MVVKKRERFNAQLYESQQQIQSESVLICPLCGRTMELGITTDEHHLIPKSMGGKDKYLLHKICHQKIHTTLTERELARHFNNWESLRAHPEIAQFIAWVKKRPSNYIDRNRKTQRMRKR